MRSVSGKMFRLFLALLLLLQISTFAQQYDLESLYTMTDSELERICHEMGFDLIRDELDEETGEKITFSHEDYVEAARQCLSIREQL